MNRERSGTHSTVAECMVSKQLKRNETQAETPRQHIVFASARRRAVLMRRPPMFA